MDVVAVLLASAKEKNDGVEVKDMTGCFFLEDQKPSQNLIECDRTFVAKLQRLRTSVKTLWKRTCI